MPADPLTVAGVVAIAGTIIGILWRDHLRSDTEDRKQRDEAIAGWRASTAALNRLSASLERQNNRKRQGDL
jgi:hypothetical protein